MEAMVKKTEPERDARVESWGMNQSVRCERAMPRSEEEVIAHLRDAAERGLSVGLRGSGCSYGDAALNGGQLLLDCKEFNRIHDLDAGSGVLTAEPGVTISDAWKAGLAARCWPAVVPGTSFASLGGALGANLHGKNNYTAGTIGEHVEDFDLVLADGSKLHCSREENEDVFHAAIGGFGLLGVMTRIRMRMKKLHSGRLRVYPIAVPDLKGMIDEIEGRHEKADYLVGWVDAFPGGRRNGRGLIHEAYYLGEGEDEKAEASWTRAEQELPSRIFGIVPKSWIWLGLWAFMNRPGMRLVNHAKYTLGRLGSKDAYIQPLVQFSFLLDFVPNWKRAYKPGGLIQYQTFVPKEAALEVHGRLMNEARRRGITPYLGVYKKHRPDPFLLTHAVDGYSLALDIPWNARTREKVRRFARDMDPMVCEAGGRFYFAKDSLMTPETLRGCYPQERLERFFAIKRRLDPDGRFQTDLFRRLFPGGSPSSPS